MLKRRLLVCTALATAACAALFSNPASAFERPFPPNIKRGTMKPDLFPTIVIDGKPRILTAGARIWNTDNMIEMPASLPSQYMVVNYTENDESQIDRVWILNSEEASRSLKQQKLDQSR
jgi:hypothetical protein